MTDKGAATTAANLRKAADHVERVGLNKGGLYFTKSIEGQPVVPLDQRPCCALGAIAEAIDPEKARVLLPESDPERGQVQDWWTDGTFTSYVHGSPEAKALEVELGKTSNGQLWITAWSDYYAQDGAEVAATMRKAADRLEAQA